MIQVKEKKGYAILLYWCRRKVIKYEIYDDDGAQLIQTLCAVISRNSVALPSSFTVCCFCCRLSCVAASRCCLSRGCCELESLPYTKLRDFVHKQNCRLVRLFDEHMQNCWKCSSKFMILNDISNFVQNIHSQFNGDWWNFDWIENFMPAIWQFQ